MPRRSLVATDYVSLSNSDVPGVLACGYSFVDADCNEHFGLLSFNIFLYVTLCKSSVTQFVYTNRFVISSTGLF